jgi:hypothetical protein
MQRLTSMFMAVAVVVGGALSQTRAAETKPIAALAVASYNNLVSDINFIGSLAEKPDLGSGLDGLVNIFGQGLAGIDKTRPWGAIVQSGDGPIPVAYMFVPVKDFKATIAVLKAFATVDSEGDVYKVTPKNGGMTLYAKSQGDWAYVSDKAEILAQCDPEPLSLLGNLKKDYVLGARVFLGNIPEALRQQFFSTLKQSMESSLVQMSGESAEDFATRKKITADGQAYTLETLSDLDQFVIGWGLDRTGERTFIDVSMMAKSGTRTAEEMNLARKAESSFAGFRPAESAVTLGWAGAISPEKQKLASNALEAGRIGGLSQMSKNLPPEKLTALKATFNNFMDMLQKVIKSGRVDAAASVVATPTSATILAAGYVADGAMLDKIVHSLAKLHMDENPQLQQIVKLDAEKSGAIAFHQISLPSPVVFGGMPQAAKLVGDTLEIVLGIDKENVYFAAGRDAMSTLKKSIQESTQAGPKSVLPLEFSVAAAPFASAVAAIGDPLQQKQAAMVESALKKTPGKDHVSLKLMPINNGLKMRLELEQGLLRLLGGLAAKNMGGGGP